MTGRVARWATNSYLSDCGTQIQSRQNLDKLAGFLTASILCMTFQLLCGTAAADGTNPESRDITALVEVTESGFRRDLVTGDLVQMITLHNRSSDAFSGQLELIGTFAGGNPSATGGTVRRLENGLIAIEFTPDKNKDDFQPGSKQTILLRFAETNSVQRRQKLSVRIKESPRQPENAQGGGGE